MKFIVVLNYTVRLMTVVVGVIMLFNPFGLTNDGAETIRIFGVIAICFGLFRLYMYYRSMHYYKEISEHGNDAENID